MSEKYIISDIRKKLSLLWKGTLFCGIGGVYILIIALLLIFQWWRPALLAFFLIGVSQLFRYIANDVDRIGWVIKTQKTDENQNSIEYAKSYQIRMLILLVVLIQLQNLILGYQAYVLAGWNWTIGTLSGLFFSELLYGEIRKVNRKIEFEQASYGFKDGKVADNSNKKIAQKHEKELTLEDKLDELKKMAEKGLISQKAYEDTRDRYLIQRVMEKNVAAKNDDHFV